MSDISISSIRAISVLDSRGRPTVRAFVDLSDGRRFSATAPAGASTGRYESVELRDADKKFDGLGVGRAVEHVEREISAALIGRTPSDQAALDAAMIELDGTDDRSHLGANAIVSVSMALARAGAGVANQPLWRYLAGDRKVSNPIPMMNVLNGGAHAAGGLRIQECMIVPHGAETSSERIRWGAEVYSALRRNLAADGAFTGLGDEGGFIFTKGDIRDAMRLLVKSIESAGYRPGADVALAIDAAANALYADGIYTPDAGVRLNSAQLTDWWGSLLDEFPLVILEDPCSEEDWPGWKHLTDALGKRVTIIGDDIFVTNAKIVQRGIDQGIANALLLKPNQIGTVTETLAAADLARKAGYKLVVSHRSGETSDTFIADLATALGAEYLKTGAPARGERTEKYNRLIEIEAGI